MRALRSYSVRMPLLPWQKPAPLPPAAALPDQAPATLDLIYNEIKASLQESAAQAGALETKAGFVLTAASLLITIITAAQAAVAGRKTVHVFAVKRSWWVFRNPSISFTAADAMHMLTVIAALIYIWVVVFAWRGYMVRKFKIISPEILYEYIDPRYTAEWQVKKMLARAMRDRYTTNQAKVDLKSLQVERALYGLLAEVLFIALMLLLLIVL
jgi:hypothetical protein